MAKIDTISMSKKAALIWSNADILRGYYKEHEYGEVILPLTVIKRLHDTLAPTRDAVIAVRDNESIGKAFLDIELKKAAGFDFYNTSDWTFASLLTAKNLEDNFNEYLNGFSDNIQDIINRFKFREKISELADPDVNMLFPILQEFNKKHAYFGPDAFSTEEMGYVFEELTKKFSEAIGDGAGEHFTSPDIVELMTDILLVNAPETLIKDNETITVYDQTMGTSQMLTVMEERLLDLNTTLNVELYGQELNPITYAIAKSEALIRGKNPDNLKFGNTLSNDQFEGYKFSFGISNPPFGETWSKEKTRIDAEHKLGDDGRFGAGLPKISDSQQLFLLNGLSKLNEYGRMAVIQNGSSLYSGNPGGGSSKIREYLIDGDYLEAIIELPENLFYNTPIKTYIWVLSKSKPEERKGKVQLIDASRVYSDRRIKLGDKKVDILESQRDLIVKAYGNFEEELHVLNDSNYLESKILSNDYFGFTRITLESPLKNDDGEIIYKHDKNGNLTDKPEIQKDYEDISLLDNIEEYILREVIPFNPEAKWNKKLDKVGYEIPFTQIFYKYQTPISSDILAKEIKEIEEDIVKIFENVTGQDVKVDE